MKTIEARCPVCRQWHHVTADFLGHATTCFNCRQKVMLIPRTRQATQFRNVIKVLMIFGGLALAYSVWQCRTNEMTRALAPMELPDNSPLRHR